MPKRAFTYESGARQRVDKFLAKAIPQLTRNEIKAYILEGRLEISSRINRKPSRILKTGDKLNFGYDYPSLIKPSPVKLVIRFENDDLLVVDKPAGIPVYNTSKKQPGSLLGSILTKYPEISEVGDAGRPGIVHRLDKQTSGLLVVAKTVKAFEYLKDLFASRKIEKEYLTLAYGSLQNHGLIDKPLTKIGQKGQSRVKVDEQGKKSVTEYWPERHYQRGLDQFTLLRVVLHTGRTHQIRVHFASEKHPVMGDNLYGKPESQKLKEILHRQFLHAARLVFKLFDGTWAEIESDLPADLQEVIQRLKIKGQSDS